MRDSDKERKTISKAQSQRVSLSELKHLHSSFTERDDLDVDASGDDSSPASSSLHAAMRLLVPGILSRSFASYIV